MLQCLRRDAFIWILGLSLVSTRASAKETCPPGGLPSALAAFIQGPAADPGPKTLGYTVHKAVGGQLTQAEYNTIRAYTSGLQGPGLFDYDVLNASLRSGYPKPEHVAFAQRLDAALRKMKPYEGKVVRAVVDLPDNVARSFQEGAVVTDRGFTSTSRSKVMADWVVGDQENRQSRFVFKIKSKTGRMLDGYTNTKFEAEVLFPPGTQFRVVRKTQVPSKIDGYPITTIELEEVADAAAVAQAQSTVAQGGKVQRLLWVSLAGALSAGGTAYLRSGGEKKK